MGQDQDIDLPKSNVKRIVTAKLVDIAGGDEASKRYQVSKDALLALSEGAKVFIHYLTTLASEACKEGKRQTISAKDVMEALKDAGFDDFLPELQGFLQRFQDENKAKTARRAQDKKRKMSSGGGGGGDDGLGGDGDGEDEGDGDDDGSPGTGGKRARVGGEDDLGDDLLDLGDGAFDLEGEEEEEVTH